MKRFATALAITSTLLLAQSCSVSPKAEEKSAKLSNPHAEPSLDNGEMHHEGHSMGDGKQSSIAVAKLTAPSQIASNTSVPLAIAIQDSTGKAITQFDTFQEKLMHLIVVSDDLQFFSHIHPDHKGNGRFEVRANFPQPGNYTIFSDYKPSGQKEQVSVLKAQVPGKSATTNLSELMR
ncbi:MAG: hypothetical protein LDL41_04260 [Coleofasciculus sp. S288]|nr:hypothetical protein [Coleofasciculus sp. S288]